MEEENEDDFSFDDADDSENENDERRIQFVCKVEGGDDSDSDEDEDDGVCEVKFDSSIKSTRAIRKSPLVVPAPKMKGRRLGGLNDLYAKAKSQLPDGMSPETFEFIQKHIPDLDPVCAMGQCKKMPSCLGMHVLNTFDHYMSVDLIIIKHADMSKEQELFFKMHRALLTYYKRLFVSKSNFAKKPSSYKSNNSAGGGGDDNKEYEGAEKLYYETSKYFAMPCFYALSIYNSTVLLPWLAPKQKQTGFGPLLVNAGIVSSLALSSSTSHSASAWRSLASKKKEETKLSAVKSWDQITSMPDSDLSFISAPFKPTQQHLGYAVIKNSGGLLFDVRPDAQKRKIWLANNAPELSKKKPGSTAKDNKNSKKRKYEDMTLASFGRGAAGDEDEGEDADEDDRSMLSSFKKAATTITPADSSSTNSAVKKSMKRIKSSMEDEPWPSPIRIYDLRIPPTFYPSLYSNEVDTFDENSHPHLFLKNTPRVSNIDPVSASMLTRPLVLKATLRKEPRDQLIPVACGITQCRNATISLDGRSVMRDGSSPAATMNGGLLSVACGEGKTLMSFAIWLWLLRQDFDEYAYCDYSGIDMINEQLRHDMLAANKKQNLLGQRVFVEDLETGKLSSKLVANVSKPSFSSRTRFVSDNDNDSTVPKEQIPLTARDDLRSHNKPMRTVKAIYMVHTHHLIEQTKSAVQQYVPDARIGIICGGKARPDPAKIDILIVSTDTLGGQDYDPDYFSRHFGLVIADEAHLDMSPFFLQAFRKLPVFLRLSFTATPRHPRLCDTMGPALIYGERKYIPQQVQVVVYAAGENIERKMGPTENQVMDVQTQLSDMTVDMERNKWLAKLSCQMMTNGLKSHMTQALDALSTSSSLPL